MNIINCSAMQHKTETKEFRNTWIEYVYNLQKDICKSVEEVDGGAIFSNDEWLRKPDGTGGGGLTKVIAKGNVFEKGGVNTSVVYGAVTDAMKKKLAINGDKWFACGISVVLHPQNPFVPTVHCNYRYFELYDNEDNVCNRWFGGGADLTPYYLFDEDAHHFHATHKAVCDKFDVSFYPDFKKNCDNYFVNAHRENENRGVGGIFFDRCTPGELHDLNFWLDFVTACGNVFSEAYLPLVIKRKNHAWAAQHKFWQEIRRGRYTEFNLVHDKGTLFGLKTSGRTESILMSLPPTVRFEYNYQPASGSEEERLVQVCLHPKEWT